MLVYFSMKNWRVFKEKSALSMRATRERFANETCAKLPAMYKGMRLLPVTSIYGPNASGKTSMLEGLSFMRHLVVEGTPVNRPIGNEVFRLDSKCREEPSSFVIEVFTGGLIYRYEVEVSGYAVLRERLSIKHTRSDQTVFERDEDGIVFDPKFDSDRHRLIAENTRSNDLFLHSATEQNAEAFRPLYDWFAESLVVLGSDAKYNRHTMLILRSDYLDFVNRHLKRYRTGIESVVAVEVPFESIPASPEFLSDMIASTPEGGEAYFQVRINDEQIQRTEIFVVHSVDGEEPTASKIRLQHKALDGRLVQFDLSDESQGTKRLLEFLPLFFDMATLPDEDGERVYVVDELDKSFHTALTADLIRTHIASCSESTRRQLVFTTHDLVLMDEELLRKDEMWFCEKNDAGESEMSCLAAHPGVRSDTDILKNYREGKLYGYPAFDAE